MIGFLLALGIGDEDAADPDAWRRATQGGCVDVNSAPPA